MRKYLSIFFSASIFLSAQNITPYQEIYGSSIYLADDDLLNSGKYEDNDKEYSIFGFDKTYYFDDSNKSLRKFVLGSVAYLNYEDKNSDIDSYFIKLGGGVDIKLNESLSNKIALSGALMFSEGERTSKVTLIDELSYKFLINGYKSYINLALRYSRFNFENANNLNGVDTFIKLGFDDKELTTLLGMPVSYDLYTQAMLLNSNLEAINNYKALYIIGTSVKWKVGPKLKSDFLKNLTLKLNLQGVQSNRDFQGYKAGISASLGNF